MPSIQSSLASSEIFSRSVQPQNVCNRASITPLGRFLIDKYNHQGNTPGFKIMNDRFNSGILICVFLFYNNSTGLIFQISINNDNIRTPQYWCRLDDINKSIELVTNDNMIFTCTEYNIVINLHNRTIIYDKNQELTWRNANNFYWKQPPPASAPSRTNNSQISPKGFNEWVEFVINRVYLNSFLKHNPTPISGNTSSKRIVLEFYNKSLLIQIYVLNGNYYLHYPDISGTAKNFSIKNESDSDIFFVEGNLSIGRAGVDNPFIIRFHKDLNKLLTYTVNKITKNLTLKEDGYHFFGGTNV